MPDDQFKTDDSDNNINKDKKNGSETKPPIKPEGKTDADTDDLVVLSNHEFLSKQVKDSKPEKSIKEEKLDETKVGSQITRRERTKTQRRKKGRTKTSDPKNG